MSDYLAKKQLTAWPLTFIAITTILGSGWLLAPAFVFSQAGTYSFYAWIIGCAMIILIALCFAEACSMVPRDGSTVILPRFTHGYLVSSMFGFLSWLSWLALIPIEAQATIQYLSHFYPSLIYSNSHLSIQGELTAILVVFSISVINYFSIKWVSWLNRYILIVIKIGIPTVIIIYSLYISKQITSSQIVHFHSIRGIFDAIPLGIIFSFNGFKSICESAGRAKNPEYSIPFAIIASLVICLIIYLLLQFAYNTNATYNVIHNEISPFATIIYNTKTPWLNVIIFLLYIGAVVSPYAANIFNLSSCNSCIYRVAKFDYIPSLLKKKNRYRRYFLALFFNTFLALIILILLNQGWGEMVNNLTSIMLVTYAIAPLCLFSLRFQHTGLERKFKLRGGLAIALVAFIITNFAIYWCGWNAIRYFLGAVIIGLIVIYCYARFKQNHKFLDFKYSIWLWLWFIGIGIISYYGSYGGGQHFLSGITALLIIAIFSTIIMLLSFSLRLPIERSTHELSIIENS